MQRITISVPDELAASLRRQAKICRKSVSEVVREILAAEEAEAESKPKEISFIGIGASGHPDLARNMDDYLAEHWPAAIRRHQDS